jgi:hypothetical protein
MSWLMDCSVYINSMLDYNFAYGLIHNLYIELLLLYTRVSTSHRGSI